MKKLWMITAMFMATMIMPAPPAAAQIPVVSIITGAAKKVIKAIDLKIQRQQNKVIWLQNAQKTLENAMAKLRLEEISEWTEKQRMLYKEYFEELQKVKSILTYYHRIKDIMGLQLQIVASYKQAWNTLHSDKHFTVQELGYMEKVYAGILEESGKNIDRIYIIINSFQTQMSDAKRMEFINGIAEDMETQYDDLRRFNQQNAILSLQRAQTQNDVDVLKKLYGLK